MAEDVEEEAEFSVDQIDAETILVRHVVELHRYAFYIEQRDGKRVIGDGITLGNTHVTLHDAADFTAAARFFAETQARQRGFID
ncbi:MAG: hypothetical protein WCF20_04640 [Methylovirgula sp.]